MKSFRVVLADWVSDDLYIDWPQVHKKLGLEQVDWLLNQPRDRCQLVLDRNEVNNKLVAEFYCEQTLTAYYLMWAT